MNIQLKYHQNSQSLVSLLNSSRLSSITDTASDNIIESETEFNLNYASEITFENTISYEMADQYWSKSLAGHASMNIDIEMSSVLPKNASTDPIPGLETINFAQLHRTLEESITITQKVITYQNQEMKDSSRVDSFSLTSIFSIAASATPVTEFTNETVERCTGDENQSGDSKQKSDMWSLVKSSFRAANMQLESIATSVIDWDIRQGEFLDEMVVKNGLCEGGWGGYWQSSFDFDKDGLWQYVTWSAFDEETADDTPALFVSERIGLRKRARMKISSLRKRLSNKKRKIKAKLLMYAGVAA